MEPDGCVQLGQTIVVITPGVGHILLAVDRITAVPRLDRNGPAGAKIGPRTLLDIRLDVLATIDQLPVAFGSFEDVHMLRVFADPDQVTGLASKS